MLSKFNCGGSCHFLLRSFHSNDLASILSFQRHCDVALFDPSSCFLKDHVLSLLIHSTGVLWNLFKFFSSYQVVLLFSTEVLTKFFLSRSLSISFQPEWFQSLSRPLSSWFSSYSLFLLSNGVFSILFISVVSFLHVFQPFKVLWFHSFVQEATLFYFFLFLFLFSFLDLESRSLVSGVEL